MTVTSYREYTSLFIEGNFLDILQDLTLKPLNLQKFLANSRNVAGSWYYN